MYCNNPMNDVPNPAQKGRTVGNIIGCCLLTSVVGLLLTPGGSSGLLQTGAPLPPQVSSSEPASISQPRTYLSQEPWMSVRIDPEIQDRGPLTAPAIVDKTSQDQNSILQFVGRFTGLAAFGTLFWTIYQSSQYSKGAITNRILRAIEAGKGLEPYEGPDSEIKSKVDRGELIKEVKTFLHPLEVDQYGIFLGPHGSGKSTAVRQALKESGTQGAVYFMAPTVRGGATPLVMLLDAQPLPSPAKDRGGMHQSDFDTWEALRPFLTTALVNYKRKHGKPALLIFDNINYFAVNMPDLLLEFQLFSKECADQRLSRVVFVGSESLALPVFKGSSAISRADFFSSEYLDITDDQAVEFLQRKYGVPSQRAQDLVKWVTGGRFCLLNNVCRRASTVPISNIISPYWEDTEDALRLLGIAPGDDFFRKLVTEKKIPSRDPSAKKIDITGLLRLNIITEDCNRYLSFHSRHVSTFFQQYHGESKEMVLG